MENDNHSFDLGKNRIEALSDGIFAIAMTLLILEFHVPDLPHDAPNVMVAPALFHLWPKFVTYIISFASLGVFWIGHHNMYHVIRRSDRVLLWLNILFFMFASFLPFSTSVLNAFMETSVAPLFFGGNLVILGWILYFQWAYANKQPGMIAPHITGEHRSTVSTRFLAYPIIAMLTMMVCFWSVPISLGIYLCLLPLYMIPGHFMRHQRDTMPHGNQDAMANAPAEAEPANSSKINEKLREQFADDAAYSSRSRDAESGRVSIQNWIRRRMSMQKKIIVGVAVIAAIVAGWAAFRPELLFVNKKVNEGFPTAASTLASTVVSSGTFHGVAHETKGNASVLQVPGKASVLRLTNFTTSNGPDVRVFLIGAKDATDNATVTRDGYLEIAKLKGNEGDQNYDIPAGTDLSKYHAVTIWCNRFHVNFATAPLMNGGPETASTPTVVLKGQFHKVAHATSGAASVYDLGNGQHVLRLTNFETSNGPDVRVYLVAAPDAKDDATVTSAGFVELGKLKGNQGDQNYDIPAGTDLAKYRAVTLWCHRFNVNFATAPLGS